MDALHTQRGSTTINGAAKRPHVVIVGAGFGGLNAAKALKDAPVDITVIDRNNHHLFQPLLYQVATAVLSPADISAPIRYILRKQKNTKVVLAEVTGIDRDQQLVLTADRSIPYDYLIVATGASHSYFGNDHWAPFAPGLKSVADATALRHKILLAFEEAEQETDPERQRALLTFILIGAGPTGVEMAGAIAELAHVALASDFRNIDPKSARIILVEALPRIMPAFNERLAKKAQDGLHQLGVEVRTGSAVQEVNEHGVVIAGQQIEAGTVIWTAGVSASPAGKWLGAELDRAGRAKVDERLNLPGYPNIFIVGDTSSATQDGKPIPGIAPAAMQGGIYAASVIKDRVAGKLNSQQFRYHNRGNLATVGRSYGIADLGKVKFTGFSAWVFWIVAHIFFLIGFRNRFMVLFQSFWGYVTFQRNARLITHEHQPAVAKAKSVERELQPS
ncbi:NAD(P)/FAD-dependent oxidoreductase [Dictyobacter formicarum]|uniref:NADH:ubiquinone reductase (non-electrogenic) n=1 Tax=Dictyobacter formicarum TaxID=2778368 RepID=A0ABQ3VJ35_9CHLR|nr:NAD(P)/FAD-dependent oxidoreductase [Dictyobacter formicarum]GHO86219.1 NADH dehydrogenase [Dictyobacter formicarum]